MEAVGIYVADLKTGGVTRFGDNLRRALGSAGFEAYLIADEGGEGDPFFRPGGVVVLGSATIPARIRALRRMVLRLGLDVLVSNGWFADLMCALAVRGLRHPPAIVSVTHVRPGLWGTARGPHTLRWAKRRLVKWTFAQASALVAVSRGLADELNAGGWADRDFQVVYNPAVPPAAGRLRKARGARDAGTPLHLVSMGWLEPRKGFDTLIRAVSHLSRTAGVRVTIIGGDNPHHPEHGAELRRLAHELGVDGQIRFAGALADPFPLLSTGDVFVFPSRNETLGLALIEAMALGLPVISADCEHGPREVLEDGRYGKLVPVDDPERLAEAIAELAGDREVYDWFQARAVERAAFFDDTSAAEQYGRIIRAALAATPRRGPNIQVGGG